MKKLFSIVFIIVFTVSCGCDETLTVLNLTEQEKNIVPYKLNTAVKWVDNNNNVHNGIVNDIVDSYSEDKTDCDKVKLNLLVHQMQFENFEYIIALYKRSTNETEFIIQEHVDNDIRNSFVKQQYITLDNFTTIEFNGETYENAVLLKQKGSDNTPFGHLVFSKTNGIEFILFEDGTWYKRVE